MSESAGNERNEIRLMNEYTVTMPLRDDEGQTDDEELGLSEALRSDLASFASRWESSIPPDVYDDRFDHLPVVRSLVDAGRTLRRLLKPAQRRAVKAEYAEMRRLGEGLRDRLQNELGDGYRVTYQH